jgi:hypothetical protein
MKTNVQALCTSLDEIFKSTDRVDPALLFKAMGDSSLTASELQDYTYFEKGVQYTRNLIHETEHYTLLLLCWNPQGSSAIHTHNNSQCWAKCLLNKVNEVVYDSTTSRNILKSTTASPGAVLYIDDLCGVHRICNESDVPAITLHCYAPAIRECEYYCVKTGKSGKTRMSNFSEYGKIIKMDCCYTKWQSCCSFENKV